MSNESHIELEAALYKYIETFFEKVNVHNAHLAISEFDENWKIIPDSIEDESKYGKSLYILSKAHIELPTTTVKDVKLLSKLVNEYVDLHHSFIRKYGPIYDVLYHAIGICWHKVGADKKAVASFKKHIYYNISSSYFAARSITAYHFSKCDKYLRKSLMNEQLVLSSPTIFNDPFDTPFLPLLESDSSDINKLMYKAYQEGLKVACFTSNPLNNLNSEVRNDEKQTNCEAIFFESLMWAHYADSHKGVCIKYKFNSSVSKVACTDENVVAYFYNINYYNGHVENLKSPDGSISFEKAFFYKGIQWKYENELRFLYFDVNGKGEHATISIPNSIEAIYFGLNCPKKDKRKILKIMKGKNVLFYEMQMDEEHFGQLRTVPYKDSNI
ncbi:MAG: DUF2971 domain-containing protein [Salinivirgaceae bacterium]|nr:DUF2971 domain-containing protein [Salinivirgaceae bacterium]